MGGHGGSCSCVVVAWAGTGTVRREFGWGAEADVVCMEVVKHSLPALAGRRALDQVVFRLAREGTMWLHYRPKKIVVKLKMCQ